MSTGFTLERAAPHEKAVRSLLHLLASLGVDADELPVDGHNPDLRLDSGEFIEVKTSDIHPALAVELDCFIAWDLLAARGERLLIAHRNNIGRWFIDTPWSLRARITGGPHRPTGNGSNDAWHKIRPGGTPIEEWFGFR